MANSPKTLELIILDREYRINCPPGAEEHLRDAARFLNEKMSEIKNQLLILQNNLSQKKKFNHTISLML